MFINSSRQSFWELKAMFNFSLCPKNLPQWKFLMNIKCLIECPQDSAMAPVYPLRRLWRAPWLVAFLRVLGMAWVYLVYFFPLASALATIEPPTELMTSEVTARSFMVNWTHTPGKVEKYRVVYYPTRGGKPEEVNVAACMTSPSLKSS